MSIVLGSRRALLGSGNLLIRDEFSDVDATALTAHAIAPVNKAGVSWAQANNTTISGGKAVVSASAFIVLSPGPASDVTMRGVLNAAGAGIHTLEPRSTNTSNEWRCGHNALTALSIIERNGGSNTTRATTALVQPSGSDFALRVDARGPVITVTNETQGASLTYSDATFQQTTATHALRLGAVGSTVDNFEVYR
jgi:hypothetical protein